MKKLLLFLIIIFLVSGCKIKPDTLLEKAKEKMETLDSYAITTNIVNNIFYSNYSMTITIDSNMNIKNGIGQFNATITYLGETTTNDGYVKIDNNQVITYTNEDNNWYYSTDQNIFKFNIFDNAKDVEEVTSDNDDTKLKITFDDNTIKDILNLDSSYTIDTNNVEIYLYINKDKYISEMIMTVPTTINDDIVKKSTINVTINFTNYNKIDDITIPDNVINSAKDNSVLSLVKNVENYILEVEYAVYDNDLANSIYTNTDLEYDGIKPTSVSLNMENGVAISGNITMDNYQFKIENSKVVSYEKID